LASYKKEYPLKTLHIFLVLFSAISFLIYGFSCLISEKMKLEFYRFKLNELQRKITGLSQIIGGCLLLLGFVSPLLGVIASGGLTILMLLGFIVRIRIKDSIRLSLPSFCFMILNGYLFYYFLNTIH
jgi:hypothetical protein